MAKIIHCVQNCGRSTEVPENYSLVCGGMCKACVDEFNLKELGHIMMANDDWAYFSKGVVQSFERKQG